MVNLTAHPILAGGVFGSGGYLLNIDLVYVLVRLTAHPILGGGLPNIYLVWVPISLTAYPILDGGGVGSGGSLSYIDLS